MDRKSVLQLIDSKDRMTVIKEYCLYKGKKEEDINKLLFFCFCNPGLTGYLVFFAVNQLKIDFNIITLSDKNGFTVKYI